MNSRRPQLGRNMVRAGSGGLAVVLALIAMMFFRGGQMGDGDTKGDGDNTAEPMASTEPALLPINSEAVTPPPVTTQQPAADVASAAGGLTSDEQLALEDGVLEILIDENEYFIVIPGTVTIYRPATMPQLLQLATQTSGDSNGIRIRILRRESSRAKAEIDLKTALAGIGIGADAVYMPQEFLAK